MRFFFLSLLILFSALVQPVQADELNAGFVQGIWYSQKDVFVGDTVRIYVALRNNTDTDLSGTIRFADGSTRIGNAYVSALPGRIVEGWVDWKPTYGEHTITASLTDVRSYEIGEDPTRATIESTLAEDILFVDLDTDSDRVGNATDTDDDEDGIPDTDEIARGTDPLVSTKTSEREEVATQKEKEALKEEVEEEISTHTDSYTSPTNHTEGLEKFVGEGAIDSVLSTLTGTITEKKMSLDTYRSERKNNLDQYMQRDISTTTLTNTLNSTTNTLATITRSRINNDDAGFIEATVGAGQALISGLYTLILWLISNALGHPATLELILLVGILYVVYRTARRFGRRPRY